VPRWFAVAPVAELLIFPVFAVRYCVVDQYMFFFPAYVLLALLAGLGAARIQRWRALSRRRGVLAAILIAVLFTPAFYAGSYIVLRDRELLPGLVGRKPFRDGYRAFLLPWGVSENSAASLNEALRRHADGDALVFCPDSMMAYGIRYAQAVGQLPSALDVVDGGNWQNVEQQIRNSPVAVLVPRDRDNPVFPVAGHWQRLEDVYELHP